MVRILIRGYQYFLSPLLGPRCRYYPSCSNYAYQCFEKFSFFKALWYSMRRISRCHPFSKGGIDEIPKM